ncbi:MAG TPA: hypothetical protein VGW74_19975, partial [Propionibacteriaceae bacterium]|nr:hypothetical protein [Propionibacteriaceae bacterium]
MSQPDSQPTSVDADADAALGGVDTTPGGVDVIDVDITDEAAEDDVVDPVEEFTQAMRLAPGEWYVVHSYAGYEN